MITLLFFTFLILPEISGSNLNVAKMKLLSAEQLRMINKIKKISTKNNTKLKFEKNRTIISEYIDFTISEKSESIQTASSIQEVFKSLKMQRMHIIEFNLSICVFRDLSFMA